MIHLMTTREVAGAIGKSVRRTQELIGEGRVLPRLEIRENGRLVSLGARPESVKNYVKAREQR